MLSLLLGEEIKSEISGPVDFEQAIIATGE